MTDMMTGLINDAEVLLTMVVGVVGIVFVIMTWVRTRSVMPTLGVVILTAVVWWGVNNYQWIGNTAGSDIQGREDIGPEGRLGGG